LSEEYISAIVDRQPSLTGHLIACIRNARLTAEAPSFQRLCGEVNLELKAQSSRHLPGRQCGSEPGSVRDLINRVILNDPRVHNRGGSQLIHDVIRIRTVEKGSEGAADRQLAVAQNIRCKSKPRRENQGRLYIDFRRRS
jgi:hypothetical protein